MFVCVCHFVYNGWEPYSSASFMATPFKFNCWVLGEDSTRVFPVEIDRGENVGGLKKAIKEEMKPAFDNITANSLEVWNVSIPIDEDVNLEAQVKNLRLHEKKPLWPSKGLHRIFRDLDKEGLHVVVKAPPSEHRCLFLSLFNTYLFAVVSTSAPSLLLLNCWVLGEDSTRIFPVEIHSNRNVGGLKDAIKEKNKVGFDHIDAHRLDVWNVSIPIDEDVNLEAQVKNLKVLQTKSLSPVQPLSGIFRNAVEERLHVIVRASAGECSPDFCFSFSNNAFLCR